jgi:DMSO/TMAO reductase YedYZ molybdopterin-dependent catalytic subunit
MVDRPLQFTYDQLLAMPLHEQYVTIACVSNEVGGNLVGNARWSGVPLRDVLDQAGVQAGASQVVGRAYDGWTCGFPTDWVMTDLREALIVVAMNGKTLPPEHGFPARLIVPGLFGYVSATKWLTQIELTTWDAFDAYWVPLGWAKEGPILTQSRIDLPRAGSSVPAGETTVAGVAWAPDRGVSLVEVQVDDGAWQAAELSTEISDATWVQWRVQASLPSGGHQLRVRATDGSGAVQEERVTPPPPDGARGYHTISVSAA